MQEVFYQTYSVNFGMFFYFALLDTAEPKDIFLIVSLYYLCSLLNLHNNYYFFLRS